MEPAKPGVQLVSPVARSLTLFLRLGIERSGSEPVPLLGKAIRLRKEFARGLRVEASQRHYAGRDHLGGPEPRLTALAFGPEGTWHLYRTPFGAGSVTEGFTKWRVNSQNISVPGRTGEARQC